MPGTMGTVAAEGAAAHPRERRERTDRGTVAGRELGGPPTGLVGSLLGLRAATLVRERRRLQGRA